MGFIQASSRSRQDLLHKLFTLCFLPILLLSPLFILYFNVLNKSHINEARKVSGVNFPASQRKLPAEAMQALLHYATSDVKPQQTKQELSVTGGILEERGPCNFLVFGLGFDSFLWAALNTGGKTVFLEEDENWMAQISQNHPSLTAYHVSYPTAVTQAGQLLAAALADGEHCTPAAAADNLALSQCVLGLKGLPEEIYRTDWDVIMIDAPRGYFPEAPGRMTAIFTAAVMARSAKRQRSMDILVHDVDREIEKHYSAQFLCPENLVAAVGKLWHFRIPVSPGSSTPTHFCSHRSV